MQNACLIKKANIAIFYLLILLLHNACKQAKYCSIYLVVIV